MTNHSQSDVDSSESNSPSVTGLTAEYLPLIAKTDKPLLITLYELITWTGFTLFEIWLHVTAFYLTTLLFTLKAYNFLTITYWHIFYPLFIACISDCYYLFIVFVRALLEYKDCRGPLFRFGFNFTRLALIAAFEFILCYKIEGDLEQGQVAVRSSYGLIFLPVWVLLAGLCSQTCRLF
ncbi:unnamed protein product [Auanema sp. JU1783]|nr:unnamed protein product [Auanema sp. JU1783]